MEKVTGDYTILYWQEDPTPPGRPVKIHITLFKVNGEVPSEAEVEAAVHRLCLNKAGGHTHICTKHFKKWLKEAYPDEGTYTHPNPER